MEQSGVRKPTFFWQGALMFLPVLVLGAISIVSLRQDEQTAERDAGHRCAANAAVLASALVSRLADEVEQYTTLQNVWFLDWHIVAAPETAWADKTWGDFPPEHQKKIDEWE